ncbi:MAG: thymidine phosphorylase family protein [Saprospiraceae bacterium]|nr:thymidine phosphorylase family protein [Saprospiraceae bacterium]
MNNQTNILKLKRLGIDTQREYFVYMRSDCHICISEGFEALTRIEATVKGKTIITTLNVLHGDLLQDGEASLSESAWAALKATEGDTIAFSHLQPVASMSLVRSKMYGNKLNNDAFLSIISDVAEGRYSNIELAAFITACAGDNLDIGEIAGLTKAMVAVGEQLDWGEHIVVDKHCIGGLPGNRTTPIVVSIIAAAGLTIPKTSSRAITSPAGTADTMETMAPVKLSLDEIRKVVKQEGGCIAWGGAVKLSPADDVLIKVEKALDVDSEGQMIASVLSKKAAAGSTHVVIDIPVGKTAKVRSEKEARKLEGYFQKVGREIGLQVKVLVTDGSQPVGSGIGPALEALDVLAVLRRENDWPVDLEKRATLIAGTILELAGKAKPGAGGLMAAELLQNMAAWAKFQAICKAQGGFREPKPGNLQHTVHAVKSGRVVEIDNRRLAKVAKLTGAPSRPGAGILLHCKTEQHITSGEAVFTLFAETSGELNYAKMYLEKEFEKIIQINR